ncbi:hypothetical protein [Victivallis vadensis]|uniref:hypothetical protein n=1 Tax=Victivallis vadensis TaxID=172901 RepID=UPI0023F09985|nr:hypothetical protein [Victivallis vadensis]
MDVRFVSESLLNQAKAAGIAGEPLYAVRFSRAFSGESGEGYFLLYPDCLAALDRKFGEEFQLRELTLDELSLLKREQNGTKLDFALDTASGPISASATFSEAEALGELLDALNLAAPAVSAAASAPAPSAAATVKPEPQPAASVPGSKPKIEIPSSGTSGSSGSLQLFAAGLLYAAASDGAFSPEQERLINQLIPSDVLATALSYYNSTPKETFFREIRNAFSEKQQTSLIANQLEVMMCDGDLRRIEMDFIKVEAMHLNYSSSKMYQIRELIILKNQLSALFA